MNWQTNEIARFSPIDLAAAGSEAEQTVEQTQLRACIPCIVTLYYVMCSACR